MATDNGGSDGDVESNDVGELSYLRLPCVVSCTWFRGGLVSWWGWFRGGPKQSRSRPRIGATVLVRWHRRRHGFEAIPANNKALDDVHDVSQYEAYTFCNE